MIRKLFLIIFIFVIASRTFAQLDTLFWFAAPEISSSISNIDRPIYLRVSTVDLASNVVVDQPANPSFAPISINIAAGSTQTIDLTDWIDQIENKPPNQVLNYGLRIVASAPVTVYYEVVSASCNCNPEIFALKGQNALGNDFFVPSQHFLDNNSNFSPVPYSSFDIISTENNTQVTITPSQNIVGHTAGVPFTITLNKGQTYSATANSQLAAEHLFGSRVISTNPVAITIKDDLLAGTPFGGCADLGGDQSIPLSIIGKEYIVVRGFLNTPFDQVFILATEDNTTISVNGVVLTTLNSGQSYNYAMGNVGAVYIESSLPVYVLQMSGFGCEVGLSVLPPIICTGSQRISFARSNSEDLFLMLLVEAGGEGNFLFNGAAVGIAPANFSPVPGTANSWMYAQITIPTTLVAAGGAGIVTNSTNFFHMGMIHGTAGGGCRFGYFSDFAKYKYEIQSNDEIFCIGDSIVLSTNVLPGATYQWVGPNGFSSVGDTLLIIPASVSAAGQYIVSGNLPDACELLPDSIDISVIESPLPQLIFSNGPVCENDSLLFWSEVVTPYTSTWTNIPNGASILSDTVLVYPAVAGSYAVEMTVGLGSCQSPPTNSSAEVFALPTITYTGLTDVCGDTVDFVATYTTDPIDNISSIYWFDENNALIGSGTSALSVQASTTPEVLDSFVVVLESQNGCIASDSFTVDFQPSPAVVFDWTDLCDASTISFVNNTGWVGNPDPLDSLSYVLNFGDGNTSIIPDTAYTYANTGTYLVTLLAVNEFGCVDSLVQQVEVSSLPSPVLTIDDGCGLIDFSVIIDNGTFPLESLSWTANGSVLSNAQSFSYAFNQAGEYNGTLTLSGSNDCSFQFPFVFNAIPSIGLEELQIPNVITANGDGVNDVLKLNQLFTNCTSYTMEFVNRWGGLVYTQSNDSLPFGGKTDQGDELNPGVYFYILRTEEGNKRGYVTVIK